MSQDRQNDYYSPLSPSERNLFSIYVQYPDLEFDNEEHFDCPPLIVPTSDSTQTNIDNDKAASEVARTDLSGYWQLLHDYDKTLPAETITYFARLGQKVIQLGQQRPDDLNDRHEVIRWLTKCVKYSSDAASEQSRRIQCIKQLVSFNCVPSEKHVWFNFRQRTKIITSNLSLPTMEEFRLVKALVNLFDQCVGLHGLRSTKNRGVPEYRCAPPPTAIGRLQKLMYIWLHNLRQWCRDMRDVKVDYMQPIYNVLRNSPRAMAEMQDFQKRRARIRETTDRYKKGGTKSEPDSSASRPGVGAARTRTRCKREHTI